MRDSIRRLKQRVAKLAIAVMFGCSASQAMAAWPSDQPINMIIAYAPGGGTDIVARSLVPFIAAIS